MAPFSIKRTVSFNELYEVGVIPTGCRFPIGLLGAAPALWAFANTAELAHVGVGIHCAGICTLTRGEEFPQEHRVQVTSRNARPTFQKNGLLSIRLFDKVIKPQKYLAVKWAA